MNKKSFYPAFNSSCTFYFCSCSFSSADYDEFLNHIMERNFESASPMAPAGTEVHKAVAKTSYFITRKQGRGQGAKQTSLLSPTLNKELTVEVPAVRKKSVEERTKFFSNLELVKEIYSLDPSDSYHFPTDMSSAELDAVRNAMEKKKPALADMELGEL